MFHACEIFFSECVRARNLAPKQGPFPVIIGKEKQDSYFLPRWAWIFFSASNSKAFRWMNWWTFHHWYNCCRGKNHSWLLIHCAFRARKWRFVIRMVGVPEGNRSSCLSPDQRRGRTLQPAAGLECSMVRLESLKLKDRHGGQQDPNPSA